MKSEIRIDQLTLEGTVLSEAEGRRLAAMIADRIGRASIPDSAPHEKGSVGVELKPGALSLEQMADQVVAEVLRQLK